MGYKTAFREVMREYERDRDKAAREAEERTDALYVMLPRVKEIDTRLSVISLSVAKHTLAGDIKFINKSRREADELCAERDELLKANAIPADYTDVSFNCDSCRDTGFVATESNSWDRCSCLKQKLINKYYDLSNLKDILKEENFDNFVLDYYGGEVNADMGVSPHKHMQMVYQTAYKFVNDFDRDFQNLFFYGEAGLGKTFMCNCIAKDLLDKGRTVLYMTAPRLFKMIEDYRFHRDDYEGIDDVLDSVTEVDLLIIDDLGAEFSTVITGSALFDIINQRLLTKKSTVISTNLSGIEALDEIYSGRIVSRLWGYFKMLKFFGEDIRLKKKYKRVQ